MLVTDGWMNLGKEMTGGSSRRWGDCGLFEGSLENVP